MTLSRYDRQGFQPYLETLLQIIFICGFRRFRLMYSSHFYTSTLPDRPLFSEGFRFFVIIIKVL
jgi:hypothetical protein